MHQAIHLDPSIRDNVFLPLIFMIFMVGILRYYSRTWFASSSPASVKLYIDKDAVQDIQNKVDYAKLAEEVKEDVRFGNALARSTRVRAAANYLPEHAVLNRKAFFCRPQNGYLHREVQTNQLTQMMNPEMMTGMLKNNLSMAVYNILLFSVVGYFFSGFIIAKVPFPLSQRFRSMLQQGLTLSELDVRYVSSLSWCFLLIFGLQGLQSLILGGNVLEEDMKMMSGQNLVGGEAPGQPKDYN